MFKKRKTAAENPFTRNMLPHTRRALWADVVKLNYLQLVIMGFALFVFAVPLVMNMLATDAYIATLQGQGNAVLTEVAVAQVTSSFVSIPLLAILAVGLSGLLRICRQYAWGDVVSLGHDFWLGIKQNIGQTVALMICTGAVYALCVYVDSLAAFNPQSNMHYVTAACSVIATVFLMPIGAYMIVCVAVYNNSFWQNFIQAFFLYMKAPIKTLLGVLCFGGVFALYLIPNTVLRFALTVVLLLGMPFLLLGWFLFTYNQLDKFVNRDKHPQLVNKGLYLEGDDSDGEDEDL